ncbi:hypothetical protein HY485_00450 [Candidatus Woesearchaeota archaeon]|nr:hypothetical protein [Candidatus Woesearchaeota archaeon]
MKLYNAPIDVQIQHFNESGSKVTFEPATSVIDDKESFAAFVSETEAAELCKKIKGGIIVFDAHPKLFIRLAENNVKNTLLVGVQHWTYGEYLFLRTNNLYFYPLREISIDGKADVCDAVMSAVKDADRLHVHINESVMDETGMSARDLLYFIHRIRLLKSIKSISFQCGNISLAVKIMSELF